MQNGSFIKHDQNLMALNKGWIIIKQQFHCYIKKKNPKKYIFFHLLYLIIIMKFGSDSLRLKGICTIKIFDYQLVVVFFLGRFCDDILHIFSLIF